MMNNTTPTPGDLSARHVEVLRRMRSNLRDAYRMDDTAAALDYAIAALSALPAAGGEVTEWRWVDERGRAMTSWKQGDPPPMTAVSDTKGTMSVEVRTTPQPPAAEELGPHPLNTCPKCKDYYMDCECSLAAAVGAQGDGAWVPREPTHEMELALSDALASGDYSIGECLARANAAAPAAGDGVDDAMVERACTTYDKTGWGHAEPDSMRAALEAALTRQPVAGDGMVLVQRMDLEHLICATHLTEAARLSAKRVQALLYAAPAATPTDGGEGES